MAIRRFDRRRLTLARWWIRQRLLRRRLVERDLVDAAEITRVAGVDISFVKESETDACAALVVCELPSLRVVYERFERVVLRGPFAPLAGGVRVVDAPQHVATAEPSSAVPSRLRRCLSSPAALASRTWLSRAALLAPGWATLRAPNGGLRCGRAAFKCGLSAA